MKIFIGCDHAGFYLKEFLKTKLDNYNIEDFGCESTQSVDYPEVAHNLCKNLEDELSKNENTIGILICGTGQGMNMVANKYLNIRSALCYDKYIAEQSRKHNNANVITLGARTKEEKDWNIFYEIVKTFIKTDFEKERHERRVKLINKVN